MDTLAKHQEAISALVDGELTAHELEHTVAQMADSSEDQLTWLTYQVTRDVLRHGPALAGGADPAFMQRLKHSLAQQSSAPPDQIAIKIEASHARQISVKALNDLKIDAANDAVFRWKWVAGLASVVMVSLVAWQVVDGSSAPAGAQLAKGATVVPAVPATSPAAEPDQMLRDPQLDALLAAHRQFGGASALQMPAGFMRNATFDGAER